MRQIKIFIYYIAIVLVMLFSMYLNGIYGLLYLIIILSFYSTLLYFFYYIWKKLRKKEIMSYKDFFINFVKKVSLSVIMVEVILFSFSYYNNRVSPAQMPTFTISNGLKTVEFQAMSHIGSKHFYDTIKFNLIKAKKNGFVYFYEGVKLGTPENMTKFDKAIGINFDVDLYKNFSKLYGVEHQDNTIYYNLVNNLDFNIDIGIDEIIRLYEDLNKGKTKNELYKNENDIIDINKEVIDSLAKLNDNELKLLVYINKAILNFIIKNDGLQDFIKENFGNKDLFEVILDKRNENLALSIQNSKYDKIFISYGLLHFEGVLKLLQGYDSNWKIIKIDYLYPIQ